MTAINRQFFDAPDVETLNILIELGQIVKDSKPIHLDIVPAEIEGQPSLRQLLLQTAAQSILSVKAISALRRRQARTGGDFPEESAA
jgi:hypothetical protein